ncbi:MAG: DNA polymerase/3'-5' exonuclease PolX [Candidatus Sumerlaeaceae bacterium]|nr:DNA polymerase/3'-5' exonuclease PolX [Candidatus Sumerlaeaceae bacterium]
MKSKGEIAAILQDIAALMEFHGENPFKCRAFDNAARALTATTEPLEALLAEAGRLEQVKGIGKATAEVIRDAADSGQCTVLRELKGNIPAGVFEVMQVPGLGPKKVRVLHDKLGVSSVHDLEKACQDGRVEKLPGFGKKTSDKLLEGISQFREFSGQFLCSVALDAATPLLAALREIKAVKRVELAGSLRRGREIIHDLDFVASSNSPQEVMDRFVSLPGISQVVAHGPTKSSVRLTSGIQADLRVVSDDQFACALQYFTGSKEHNTQIRGRAKKMGLRVNEYGIFHANDGDEGEVAKAPAFQVKDEAAFYKALGLSLIPPELREGLGEVEAAEAGGIPKLIDLQDYRGVLHCHSTWSDGKASIREMAMAARDQWKLDYFAVCDHSEAAFYANGVKKGDLARQHEEIDELNDELGGKDFQILKGCECDILGDGELDYPAEYLAKMDVVVASVHSRFQLPPDEMTQRLLRAIENPYTTILGHPTGRLLLGRSGYSLDMEAVLRKAAETGTVIEINGDPRRLDLDWRLCRHARDLGVKFSVNPDAHSVAGLRHILFGLTSARKGWLTSRDVINCLSLAQFLKFVRSLRESKLARA